MFIYKRTKNVFFISTSFWTKYGLLEQCVLFINIVHILALKTKRSFLKVVTWVMNDPLKYETRHLLFEVGDLAKFLRDLLLLYSDNESLKTIWGILDTLPLFLQQSIAHFATRCRFANAVFYELKASSNFLRTWYAK